LKAPLLTVNCEPKEVCLPLSWFFSGIFVTLIENYT
jgi:hypothetical protein